MSARRVAFLTGASRGIGRGGALALARRGFDLVLTARTVTERMAAELGESGFDASTALPVENPGRVCAMLATATDPMAFSGRDVDRPSFYAEHALVRFEP